MASAHHIEAERKFLLQNDSWRAAVTDSRIFTQAYLCKDPERTVRIRIAGDQGFITIKGQAPAGRPLDTPEFEYEIPLADAKDLLTRCLPGEISKARHYVPYGGKTWEIDVFEGANKGLTVAEVELTHAEEDIEIPSWIGAEVTFDPRYKNSALASQPFSSWGKPPAKAEPQP